ncbi:MAG TPA: GNAT family protein [Streptosporangiaceae bacterium]|nr:GNAT family protein [Streptosporangiaceae bacterium]
MPGQCGIPQLTTHWPIAGLRARIRVGAAAGSVSTIELRLPDDEDLSVLAALAEAGVHDPALQPFSVAWTDVEPAARAQSVLQYHWRCLGDWSPDDWTLNLVVVRDGAVVGTQGISAKNYRILREVGTGSWLGRRHQGKGTGTAMRAAVLALAFDGLGADYALSEAFTDNPASLAVSRKLGYADDGMERMAIRGRAAESRRLRIARAAWQAAGGATGLGIGEVAIDGLEPCLPLFGAGKP